MVYKLVAITTIGSKTRIFIGKNAMQQAKLKEGQKIALLMQGESLKIEPLKKILKKGIKYHKLMNEDKKDCL